MFFKGKRLFANYKYIFSLSRKRYSQRKKFRRLFSYNLFFNKKNKVKVSLIEKKKRVKLESLYKKFKRKLLLKRRILQNSIVFGL